MTKLYTAILALFMATSLVAQIKQVTDLNATGDAGIGAPYLYNGELYFEADAGDSIQITVPATDGSDSLVMVPVGDELYKLTASGETVLVKNINTDIEDSTPNGDPKNFIEFNGKLYFNANGGDYTGVDLELFVTDGTEEGTQLVYDFNPALKKGGNPQQMFVFNNALFMQVNDGISTQFWKYDGSNDPVKITTINNGGFATPMNPIVDEENNITYFQANNSKAKLFVLKLDDTYEELTISGTSGNTDLSLTSATLFNGKLYFEGDNGTDNDQLWVSDGTNDGTMMVKVINADGNADPSDFIVYNDELYFVATDGSGTQLWKTDGTDAGTVKVLESVIEGFEASDLIVAGNKIFFMGSDNGVIGEELYVFDGTDATLVKNIASADSIDASLDNFVVVDDLLFFEAATNGESSDVVLWASEGTDETTVEVATLFETSENPTDVNTSEIAIYGTVLFFTGDDAFGDEIFSVDASMILGSDVVFTVSDNNGVIEGATVTFNGQSSTTDADGVATFEHARNQEYAYEVSTEAHNAFSGFVTVDGDESVEVNLTITSIEDDLDQNLKVYPNPANSFVNISNSNDFDSYRIFTMNGRVVAQGETSPRINLNLNSGVYFIELRSGSANVTRKLIVE